MRLHTIAFLLLDQCIDDDDDDDGPNCNHHQQCSDLDIWPVNQIIVDVCASSDESTHTLTHAHVTYFSMFIAFTRAKKDSF